MYSVAQVLSPEFARTWNEAVAIVQEAASQLHPDVALPGPEDLIIDDAGALSFGFGSESSESPVAALAGLLDGLLDGVEAPQSLRELVSQNIGSSPAHATVASFSQALAFFERPNRTNDIRAVATRLSGFRQKSTTDQEFERLRERVAAHPAGPEPQKQKKEEGKRQPRLSKAQQMIVVAAVCVMVFGTLGYRSGLHRSLGVMTASVEGAIQGVVGTGLEKLGVSKAASAADSESAPRKENEPLEKERERDSSSRQDRAVRASTRSSSSGGSRTPVRPEHTARKSGAAVATAPPAAAKPSNTARTTVPGSVASAPSATPPAVSAPAASGIPVPPGDGAIFSEDHPQVQAPVLVRPQLPKEPAPGDDTGIFDMLVDENGDVMQVRLISPRRRYHDRMLVAAAKAWKFRPAMLNGFPVKYRIRIPIILKGMP